MHVYLLNIYKEREFKHIMKTQHFFQISSIFYKYQNKRTSNSLINISIPNNIFNNNTKIYAENNIEIYNIYKNIEDINIKIKI